MSKRWDEAELAAAEAMSVEFGLPAGNGAVYVDVAGKALEAFALSLGPSGPAALKDWVEGRAVLVPRELTQEMAAAAIDALDAYDGFGGWSDDVWRAMLKAASPAAPDGETK